MGKIKKISTRQKEREHYGHEVMSWSFPEFDQHDRDAKWYIVAGIFSFLFILYAFWTNNFLFAVIVVIALFIIVLHHENDPIEVDFIITTDGVVVGSKFIDYSELKNFAIVYQPKNDVKRLYFEYKSVLKYRVSIPVLSQDPLIIRENLLKYLPEDLEREVEPLSENLSRFLKL
ncbi:hypothetical protein ISS03_03115 [Patescibacteria group bacterium]|nr:hypothetical protein [Patescibacteria group bacterium]